MSVQYAIKSELFAGRSGRPWREAMLGEIRLMHRNLLVALTGNKDVELKTGIDYLPPLDKSPEEVNALKEEYQEYADRKQGLIDSTEAVEEWLQRPDK